MNSSRYTRWPFVMLALTVGSVLPAQSPSVKEDPLVRMPGTQPQPENSVALESPGRCLNCHAGYNPAVEPGHNWSGSMMAHSMRDFVFWSCLTVAAQDSIHAIGRPNATDICLRCHSPKGWLEGRSDPPNGVLMQGADFDGVQCDFCHSAYDPFFEETASGVREGSDWLTYWDETNASGTPSQPAANATYLEDASLAATIRAFNGQPFFGADNLPISPAWVENGSGQYFASPNRDKRAPFADAAARHQMLYSRYHKSKYFCSTCHDVSNPVLANLGADPAQPLPTETRPAHSFFHVERTFSEFMLSAYGAPGGSSGLGPFAPSGFDTSLSTNNIVRCQDCHMRDTVGQGCNKNGVPVRPGGSVEHPLSGQPIHDLTGGNVWVSSVIASAIPGSPNYDATNDALLNQGPSVLTLDLTAGEGVDPGMLLDGADRALQQLQLAASIDDLTLDPQTGAVSFRVQNQTGHRLISGFPEGRRMFLNVRAYAANELIWEVNPYDDTVGTLRGLDPDTSGNSPPLAANEAHDDALVYEMHPSSTITGEAESFHFALADNRYKDNRIPPKGFRIADAAARLCQPRWHGADAPDYFTAAEYAGGYDAVTVSPPAGVTAIADRVEVSLYYQTTSREYMEFLRDEINGTPGRRTLPDSAYVIQGDTTGFFDQLKAWGDTIWQLWSHNRDLPGAAPVLMAFAAVGDVAPPPPDACPIPGTPEGLSATGGRKRVDIQWSAPAGGAPPGGYNLYYDQAGKLQYIRTVNASTLSYTDRGLSNRTRYCYVVAAWSDCDRNGSYDAGLDIEGVPTAAVCATTD